MRISGGVMPGGICLSTVWESEVTCAVAVSVCAQLGFLGYFKYAGFLADNLFLVSRWLGYARDKVGLPRHDRTRQR